MAKFLELLEGKKTYLVGVIGIVIFGLQSAGVIDLTEQSDEIAGMLIGLATIVFRAMVKPK